MGEMKGSSLVFLRNSIKNNGPELEKKFLAKLTAEESKTYTSFLAFNWYPIEIIAGLYEKAAPLLFPGDRKQSLRKFGMESMHYDLNTIYKIILRMATIPFIVEQTAKLWKSYMNKGEAKAVKKSDKNQMTFQVINYSTLPNVFYETIAGTMVAMVNLTGVKNINITTDNSNLEDLRWDLSWH